MSVFAHKDSSVTADGVFLFIALAKCVGHLCDNVPLDVVSCGLWLTSVVGILYQMGLVLGILYFPL